MVHVLATETSRSTNGSTAATMETTITGHVQNVLEFQAGHVTSGGGTGVRRRCVGGMQTM